MRKRFLSFMIVLCLIVTTIGATGALAGPNPGDSYYIIPDEDDGWTADFPEPEQGSIVLRPTPTPEPTPVPEAPASDDPEVLVPYFTASGTKLILNTNGHTVNGITYMYTENEYEYSTWAKFVKQGKQRTDINTSGGYRTSKGYANGSTIEVSTLGWYNFVITYDNKTAENFCSVCVSSLSTKPSATVNGDKVTFSAGDFTVQKISWIYGGTSEYPCTSWSAMQSRGLADKAHNGTNGYRNLSGALVNTPYTFDETGYYTFMITYNTGVVFSTVHIENEKTLPSLSAGTGTLELNFGDYTVTGCKYIWTSSLYSYSTWANFVSTGKLNTSANTKNGYRNFGTISDGASQTVSREGYYTAIITYETDGQVGEIASSVQVEAGATKPTVTASGSDSVATTLARDVTLTKIRYIYTGDTEYTYTNLDAFIAKGKQFRGVNGSTGYKTVSGSINAEAGTTTQLYYSGWYTFLFTYTDGECARTLNITEAQAKYHKPYAEIDGMDITIYANSSSLYEILYMYTYEPYTYTTWSDFYTKGKENKYINSNTGYRTIDATGDTSFTCFEMGYYNFILKYEDSSGRKLERFVSVSPEDSRANIYLQAMGGYVISPDWQVDENNDTLYTRKVIGTVALPTPSVPKGSEIVQFAGWYTDLTYTTKVTSVNIVADSPDVTYYAKWTYSGTEYNSEYMHYGIGHAKKYIESSRTQLWGITSTVSQVKMTCDHNGFFDYYKTNLDVISANSTADLKGEAMNLPYTLGADIFKELDTDLYVAKVINTNGSYVEISFILYNAGDSAYTNFSIGCGADVNINGNGYAPIQANYDPEEGTYLLMEQAGYAFRIYMNEADYWIGRYSSTNPSRYFYNNVFNTSSDQANHWDKRFASKDDSALCFNWRNFDIPAGKTVVKTIRIGVGSTASMGSTSKAIIKTNANGGAFEDESTSKTVTANTAKIEVSTLEIPTRDGYTFVGWNTSSVGAGLEYEPSAMVSNVQLYALWTKNNAAQTYKLVNKSVITAGEDAVKLGSAVAKITLNYTGGLVQQGTSALNAVSTDSDFVANISITEGYYLPNNITVKVGGKWLTEGVDFIYSPNETMTGGTIIIYKENLTGNTTVYINGTDSPAVSPVVTVDDVTTYVKQTATVSAVVEPVAGYTYSYKWYKVTNLLGSNRKALSSASAKTADLAFGGSAYGDYYYICKVTATRTVDNQTAETVSEVAVVHVVKQELETTVLVDDDGNVSLSNNPENKTAIFTFYTDEECTNKTGFETGAPDLGEKPIKPLTDGGSYYVQATIPEGKAYLSCTTDPVLYDKLPDLPFLTSEGNNVTINDNDTGVTAVKIMYSENAFSYTKWSKYTKEGKLKKKINSSEGYRTMSRLKDSNGDPISMDGTVYKMEYVGYYTFLLSFGGDKEVAYTIICSAADLAYHKPNVYQPSTNGRLVLINDNTSHLVNVKYMYTEDPFTYSKWATYVKEGKKNTIVNSKDGFRTLKGTVTDDVSSLDGFAITLSNEGYYTFLMTYDDGAHELAQTVVVSGDHTNNDNLGLLLVENGTINALTSNGDRIEYIKFATDDDYKGGNVLYVNATGTYNIAAIDENGYTYYMVAYVDRLTNEPAVTVDKSALLTKYNSAVELEGSVPDIDTVYGVTPPGKYIYTENKEALEFVTSAARDILDNESATQSEVNSICTDLDAAMTAFKAAIFTVDPNLVTVSGANIVIHTNVPGYTLKVVRYNVNEGGTITPSYWDNWTGFSSMKYKTKTPFEEGGRAYTFYGVDRGIYTLLIQQNEDGRVVEYYEYAVVTEGSEDKADVIIDYLNDKIERANEILEGYPKESGSDIDEQCISDSKWNALNAKKLDAIQRIEELEETPSKCNPQKKEVPLLIALTRAINQAVADEHVKTAPTVYDPIDISVDSDNVVTLTHGNLAYAYISYGHYKTWAKVKSAGYKKVTAKAAPDDMFAAVYSGAKYNGEYTALVHYKNGKEEFKYFTLSGIEYPFTVSESEGFIIVNVSEGVAVQSVNISYGADKKDLSDNAYVKNISGTDNAYELPAMGNGMHTVNVQTADASYFVNIEITTMTVPHVVVKESGVAGVFTNGVPGVSSVGMKSGSTQTRTGLTYPLTNEWLSFTPSSTYTFYYNVSGDETYETITF